MKISHIPGCILALGLAMPGLSQTADHNQHNEYVLKTQVLSKSDAAKACTPEHAAMGHCKLDKKEIVPAAKKTKLKDSSPDPTCSPEHAAMGHCTPKENARPEDEHDKAGAAVQSNRTSPSEDSDCSPEHAAMGHCTPKQPVSESKANGIAAGTNLPAGNAPAPDAPEVRYADQVWGREAMAPARELMYQEHGGMFVSKFALDLAAARYRDGEDGYQWDGEAWLGGDLNRIVIKSEGESYSDEAVDGAEVQALYSRAIGPYFNLQTGVRQDVRPEPSRTYAAFGFEGLAPYWNEIEGTLFISAKGDVLGRFKGHYDQLITQRFVLETFAEINLSAQEMQDEGIGSGIVDAELSLRLHYEIEREIAPYIGISWKSKSGDTARLARASGEGKDNSSLLAGLRLWM